jgi:hypothetical protein
MKRIIEKRSNEAVVHLHLSPQHTWPQLYACLSIVCPFCISHSPQLGQLSSLVTEARKSLLQPLAHWYVPGPQNDNYQFLPY